MCFTPRQSRTIVFSLSDMITVQIAARKPNCQTATHTYPTADVRTSSPSLAHNTPCLHVRRHFSANNMESFPRRQAKLEKNANTTKHASSASCSSARYNPIQATFTAEMMPREQLTDGTPAWSDVIIR